MSIRRKITNVTVNEEADIVSRSRHAERAAEEPRTRGVYVDTYFGRKGSALREPWKEQRRGPLPVRTEEIFGRRDIRFSCRKSCNLRVVRAIPGVFYSLGRASRCSMKGAKTLGRTVALRPSVYQTPGHILLLFVRWRSMMNSRFLGFGTCHHLFCRCLS